MSYNIEYPKNYIYDEDIMAHKFGYGEISQILENLFLTDLTGAHNYKFLIDNKIDHVVSLTLNYVTQLDDDQITYHMIPIDDLPNINIVKKSKKLIKKIGEYLDNGSNVLCHCDMGISRSPSFVLMLLLEKGYTFDEAYVLISTERQIVDINKGFIKQIKKKYNRKNIFVCM